MGGAASEVQGVEGILQVLYCFSCCYCVYCVLYPYTCCIYGFFVSFNHVDSLLTSRSNPYEAADTVVATIRI